MKTSDAISVLVFLALAGMSLRTSADPRTHAGHALGTLDFPVSCSEAAQAEFNRAVALLHHMTYPQAREAFRKIATTEPGCAMAHWGVAMTLFQPLWPTRPGPADLQLGLEEVRKARSLEAPTPRERLFIAAAAAFFEEPSLSYWQRIGRWEQAMQEVHAAAPQDPEATAFYALALLAVTPPDRTSREQADRAAALLMGVYRQNNDHPGAMHYLVHANDVPGREHELLEIVQKYETVAPRNPHALHMPTHIYTRLGRWDAVIRGNLKAAEAALEHPAGDQGQFVWDEFPHAIEYLVYAHLQQGADGKAAEQLERLQSTQRLEPTFKTAFHAASIQARYALERRKWEEAHTLRPRQPPGLDWDRFMWPEAVTWFARGLGAAHEGQLEDARAAIQRLSTLEATADKVGEDLFTRTIRVLRLGASAWLAHAEKKEDSAVTLMKEAAQLEESTPKHAVTPAPTLPAYEMLGDLFSELKQPGKALAAYEHSLALYPGRFNSLLGAARSARDLGDEARARKMYQRLLETAASGNRENVLEEARLYMHR